jgi:hypothetical protein
MTLQTFVGYWPLFRFLNPIHSRYDSLDGGSARHKAATYTQNNTNTEETHTDINALSGIQTQDTSVRASQDSPCLRPRGHCDLRPNATGAQKFKCCDLYQFIGVPTYNNIFSIVYELRLKLDSSSELPVKDFFWAWKAHIR